MPKRLWIQRQFDVGLPPSALPDVIERIRGTPLRLEERVADLPRDALIHRPRGNWSIQEHVGHVLDLEPLWSGRLDDLDAGCEALRAADMSNRRTHEALHNDRDVGDLLREFRTTRATLVARAEALSDEDAARIAVHPRLKQPMNAVDLLFFVAEHDDHHLATISAIRHELA